MNVTAFSIILQGARRHRHDRAARHEARIVAERVAVHSEQFLMLVERLGNGISEAVGSVIDRRR
jgi:hypothetical protein